VHRVTHCSPLGIACAAVYRRMQTANPPTRAELRITARSRIPCEPPVAPGAAGAHPRGRVFVGSTTCWKVGRFWNGNGGTDTALALVKRFMSKQLACGFSAHAPWP